MTSSPRFRSANTAATLVALDAAGVAGAAGGGGGGGGGGGSDVAALASCELLNSWMLTPYFFINDGPQTNNSNGPWDSKLIPSGDTVVRSSLFRREF